MYGIDPLYRDDAEYVRMREQALNQMAPEPLTALTDASLLHGRWNSSTLGPLASDDVFMRYIFNPDGSMTVEVPSDSPGASGRWELRGDGSILLSFDIPADPTIPGLEEDTIEEDLRLIYRCGDDRIVLSNADTSVVELLTRREH